ncbi:flagellar protein G [Thermococcus sp.]
MPAGGPASELILFIVAVIVAGTVAGALAYVTNDISNNMKARGEALADQMQIDFAIINDPENIPTSGGGYLFYIKNIGRETFPFNNESVHVFIDGNIIPPSNLTFLDLNNNPISSLQPYQVGIINVTTTLTSGQYYKLVVVLENGKERELIFKAP